MQKEYELKISSKTQNLEYLRNLLVYSIIDSPPMNNDIEMKDDSIILINNDQVIVSASASNFKIK